MPRLPRTRTARVGETSTSPLAEAARAAQRTRVLAAMRRAGGVVVEAARELEISRQALYDAARRLDIDLPALGLDLRARAARRLLRGRAAVAPAGDSKPGIPE